MLTFSIMLFKICWFWRMSFSSHFALQCWDPSRPCVLSSH